MKNDELTNVRIRQAGVADLDAMAIAHCDSIQSLGPAFYPANTVADWQAGVNGALYRRAMQRGEVFFIATGTVEGEEVVIGFSSDYPVTGTTYGTSVYVRGTAARRGIGSALLRTAEAHALAHGATDIVIDASLAGADFYRVHGYVEVRRGETLLSTGRPIECVFMRKDLSASPGRLE